MQLEAGLGIALMPRSSFREELRLGRLRTIAVTSLNTEQPVVAVRRRGGHHSVLAVALLEILERWPSELSRRTRAAKPSAKRRKASGMRRSKFR